MLENFEDDHRVQHPEGTLCSRYAGISSQDGEGMLSCGGYFQLHRQYEPLDLVAIHEEC